MRKRFALILNLIVPGAGLILLQRDGLGLVISLLFCVCAQIGLWGWWIVPASVPRWITFSGMAGAGVVWLGAQYLLRARMRTAFAPGIEHEIERLCAEARQAFDAGEFAQAEELLLVALTLNDEDVRVNALWAELMTSLGRFQNARRAWRRVIQLADDAAERRQAAAALASLP